MINNYEVAEAIELDSAHNMILGEKVVALGIDTLTLEFGKRYMEATDD